MKITRNALDLGVTNPSSNLGMYNTMQGLVGIPQIPQSQQQQQMFSKTQKPDLLKKSIQGSLNTSGTGNSMLPQAIKPQGNNN